MTRNRSTTRRATTRRPDETKSAATRRHLLDKALALFQKKGVERTTMRDIAKAAKLSLGAAYYYFPSKEALMFAYYEANQNEIERRAATVSGTLRERLGQLFHIKLETIRPHRAMLASVIAHLVNPGDPLSAFSAQSRGVRDRAIGLFARTLDGAIPAAAVPGVANALWLLHLAAMLLYVNDASPGERRTHGLVDDGLDLIVPLLPLLASPPGVTVVERVTAALERAGISPSG
jgi:AcrR family transcriptional regulator